MRVDCRRCAHVQNAHVRQCSLPLPCAQWNERPWGTPDWTKQYRKAMDAIGFSETKIIIPDGGDVTGIEKAMLNDSVFAAAVDGLGVHCTTVPIAIISCVSCGLHTIPNFRYLGTARTLPPCSTNLANSACLHAYSLMCGLVVRSL